MPLPRTSTVIPGQAGLFHCYSRCVRRSYLCGTDQSTGQSFEHRRQWIVDRFVEVTRIFAVDVYAYAVMENHYHVVLSIDPARVREWSDCEVKKRWSHVFAWRNRKRTPVTLPENPTAELVATWRERLGSLSWMMRCVNEPIARWSNAEDDVTGHFWESRFKSLPLLDEGGLLACMCYADLNPIRAGMAIDPADSDYTSIQQRIVALQGYPENVRSLRNEPLKPVLSSHENTMTLGLRVHQYIDLVYATAIDVIKDSKQIKKLLRRFGLSVSNWCHVVNHMMKMFRTAVGNGSTFGEYLELTNRSRKRDLKGRQSLYQ